MREPLTADDISTAPVDRPAGLLNETDRKKLQSGDISRSRRGKIRKRTINALMDFSHLLKHLSDKDRRLIFDNHHREKKINRQLGKENQSQFQQEDVKLENVWGNDWVAILAFLIKGTSERELEPFDEDAWAYFIECALALSNSDKSYTVDIESIDAEPDTDDLYRRFQKGESLNNTELAHLLRQEHISYKEFEDAGGNALDLYRDI